LAWPDRAGAPPDPAHPGGRQSEGGGENRSGEIGGETKALIALETYVSGLADLIIDYASARLDDEPSPRPQPRAPCSGCCTAGWERSSKCGGRRAVLI
jgi:hypothetical protein